MSLNSHNINAETLARAMYELQTIPGFEDTVDKLRKDVESLFAVQKESKGVKKFDTLTYYSSGIVEFEMYDRYGSKTKGRLLCSPWQSNKDIRKKSSKGYSFNVAWLNNIMPESMVDILRYINSKGKLQKKYFEYTYFVNRDINNNCCNNNTKWRVTFIEFIKGVIQHSLTGSNQYSLNINSINSVFYNIKEYFAPMECIGKNWKPCPNDNLNDNDFCIRYVKDFDGFEEIVKNIILNNINDDRYLSGDGNFHAYRNHYKDESLSQIIANTMMTDYVDIEVDYDEYDSSTICNDGKDVYCYEYVYDLYDPSRGNTSPYYDRRIKKSTSELNNDEYIDTNYYDGNESGFLMRKTLCKKYSDISKEGYINCYTCFNKRRQVRDSSGALLPYCNITDEMLRQHEMHYAKYFVPILLRIYNAFDEMPECDFKNMMIRRGFYDPNEKFKTFMIKEGIKKEADYEDD